MNKSWLTWVKAGGAVIALLVLAVTVNNYLGEYRSAANARKVAASVPSTESATPSDTQEGSGSSTTKASDATPAEAGQVVIVKMDGLNLREEPNQVAKSIRKLKKNEKLTLLEKATGWYKVKSAKDETGWISSKKTYVTIQKKK